MKESIDLSGVTETMLVPLYSRARESRKDNPLFYDATAVKVMDNLDYDFEERFKKSTNFMNFWGCCARTIIIDEQAEEFISRYPDCTVINLGAGLDDRFSRVDNGKLTWYNVDFDEIIDLRKKLIDENDRVFNIASSVLDFEWLDRIKESRDVLVIAEGFLMYLEKDEVKTLFDHIYERFDNIELVIELMAEWMVKNQKVHDTTRTTGAIFRWGVKESREFEDMSSFRYLREYNLTDGMKRYSPIFITIVAPFLRSRNNRIAVFEKI